MPRGDGLFRKVGKRAEPVTLGTIVDTTIGRYRWVAWRASDGERTDDNGKRFEHRDDAARYAAEGEHDYGFVNDGRNRYRIIKRQF